MKKLELRPSLDAMSQATDFVEETLSLSGVPMKVIMRFQIAVDEVFSNIAQYSNAKYSSLECGVDDGCITLVFTDDGVEYDPTAREEPDVTLSAEDRDIGGLGIYMVKKSMDSVEYEYLDGKNILTLKKKLN